MALKGKTLAILFLAQPDNKWGRCTGKTNGGGAGNKGNKMEEM
jgi:hypothetical protein